MIFKKNCIKQKNRDKNKCECKCDLINVIKSGLVDSENKIEGMSKNEIKNERLYDIVYTIENILYVNKQSQEGQGLKILTPDSLAQLKAGNNSEKLRQLLYSLYRSKKLTKTIYNNLINTI